MLTETILALFNRELNRLKNEITAYQREENIWVVEKSISNSAGNLCLHLVGNLNHFIGSVYADNHYIRQRDLEFSLKNIPRAELIAKIDTAIEAVNKGLTVIPDAILQDEYPILVFDKKTTVEYFLIHLATHLSYHLGQINYHRRLLDIV